MFSTNRQSVKENCNPFKLIEQRGKLIETMYHDLLNEENWKKTYFYIVIDIIKKTLMAN